MHCYFYVNAKTPEQTMEVLCAFCRENYFPDLGIYWDLEINENLICSCCKEKLSGVNIEKNTEVPNKI